MSPEIGSKVKTYGYNVDIWSLGIVLYELITKTKPWNDNTVGTAEFLELVISKDYPSLPEDTPNELKYLVEIMLKKDPRRRAEIKDLLRLDFIYNRATEMIKEYNWENIEDFKFGDDITQNIKSFYLNFKVLNQDDEHILYLINKLTYLSCPTEYKASFFGTTIKDAFNGDELLAAFSDEKFNEDNIQEEQQKEIIKKGLEKKILIPLSHSLSNNLDDFVNKFFADPNSYYFQSKCFNFDPYNRTCDNNYMIQSEDIITEDTDFLLFSQYILDCGMKVINNEEYYLTKEKKKVFIFDKNYLKFLTGIAYFQKCDPFKIPYDSEHKDRLAFFYNLYQIFGIHCYYNNLMDLNKTKSALYGYFQNDVKLVYKFKNFSLSHLDILHVIFRSNKPIPGHYMRLVYNSDIKCKLIPNFNSPEALFVAYKVNDSFYTIYNQKELEFQLEERILKFIPDIISIEDNELTIDKEFKPFIKDFGAEDTEEKPIGFLNFLIDKVEKFDSYFKEDKEHPGKQLYKTRLSYAFLLLIKFLDSELVNSVEKDEVTVNYYSEKENDNECFSII